MSQHARFAAVRAILEAEAGLTYPGAVLLAGKGGLVHTCTCQAVGQAQADTWFDLASLTKALCTSVLAMRLWQAGVLDLFAEVLPGVRVEHLLSHESGLPAWLPLHALTHGATDPRQAIMEAAAQAERGPAGARAVYSDLGFILLARVLEEAGGDRLDRLFAPIAAAISAELSFRPADRPSAVPVPDQACAPTRRESPERELLQGVVHDDNARAMLGVSGHAGLFGTAAGVSQMAGALISAYHGEDQGLGLRAQTVRHFFARRQREQVPDTTWGLGWDHPSAEGSSAGTLWPREGVGHLGFTGCSLWLDPAARRWVVLLSNRVAVPTTAEAEVTKARIKALRPRLHDEMVRAWP